MHRAAYGSSRLLGDVEFLSARFGSHRFAPHTHPVFAIGCVERGACRVWHRGEPYVAGPGDLILINPGDPHSAASATGGSWDYSAMYFPAEAAARWLPGRVSNGRGMRLVGVVGRDPGIAHALSALCRTLERDPDGADAEPAFAGLVRSLFSRFASSLDAVREVEESERVDRVRRYLDDHYTAQIRIDELADMVGQNPFRLIRDFSRAFGMPPYTYLSHVRVEHARSMLKAGRPITETALSVGFTDQSHLTKFFRRITGVPPGLYAKGVAATRRAPGVAAPGSC